MVEARRDYDPKRWLGEGSAAARALAWVADDRFAGDAPGVFEPLLHHLTEEGDPYCVLADFESYRAVQRQAAVDFGDADGWARRSGLNTARMGAFSSDRAIREYASRIWGIAGLEPEAADVDG